MALKLKWNVTLLFWDTRISHHTNQIIPRDPSVFPLPSPRARFFFFFFNCRRRRFPSLSIIYYENKRNRKEFKESGMIKKWIRSWGRDELWETVVWYLSTWRRCGYIYIYMLGVKDVRLIHTQNILWDILFYPSPAKDKRYK